MCSYRPISSVLFIHLSHWPPLHMRLIVFRRKRQQLPMSKNFGYRTISQGISLPLSILDIANPNRQKGGGSFSTGIGPLEITPLIHSDRSIPTRRTQKYRNPLYLLCSDDETASLLWLRSYATWYSIQCFFTTRNILNPCRLNRHDIDDFIAIC